MFLADMSNELLLPVGSPSACAYARFARRKGNGTAPCFTLVMTCVLMTLPVVLRTKSPIAGGICACIRTSVALLMLSIEVALSGH